MNFRKIVFCYRELENLTERGQNASIVEGVFRSGIILKVISLESMTFSLFQSWRPLVQTLHHQPHAAAEQDTRVWFCP